LLVVVLVVVLLSCCCCCLHLLCCRVANIATTATVGTTPPMPPLSVGMEVDGDGAQDNHNGVGHYLIVWAIKFSNGKNQEQRYTMALGGHQTQIKTQQPTINTRA
jgi:hypothetical protein